MSRGVMAIALAVVAGATAPAFADPHMNFHSSTTLADGSRIVLTGTFRTDVDTNADGTVTAFNATTLEIELQPGPGTSPGTVAPGSPDRFRITARVNTNGIDPCFMPASVLMALGLVTADDVQRILGFTPTITEMRNFGDPPEPIKVQRVLGLLLAQANTLNPAGAALATRLVDLAFGLSDPPTPISVCLPETPPPSPTP